MLLGLLGGEVAERLRAAWWGREFGPWYERPLLLLSAIRDDALRQGAEHPIWGAIGVHDPDPGALTPEALTSALDPAREHLWRTLAVRYVQTNDVARAIAWVWPASIAASTDPQAALTLVDVGASAGLTLVADRIRPPWARPDGTPLRLKPLPPIADRTGYDLRPLDVRKEADARWLRACVWPGQKARARRLEEAITSFRSAASSPGGPRVERLSAERVAERLPAVGTGDVRVLVYGTIMRDYLSDRIRERYLGGIRAWLRACPPGTAIFSELEVTTEAREGSPPVDLTVHVPGERGIESVLLARCEPHPEVIEVDEAALERLRAALAR